MASDYQVPSVARVNDVARTQRVQEIRAESAQHGLRARSQEETEKCSREVRPSPESIRVRVGPQKEGRKQKRGNPGKKNEDSRDDAKEDKGRILDVLC